MALMNQIFVATKACAQTLTISAVDGSVTRTVGGRSRGPVGISDENGMADQEPKLREK